MRQYGNMQYSLPGYAIVEVYEEDGAGKRTTQGFAVLTDSGVEIALYAAFDDAKAALLRSVAQEPKR